ncbi:hypothetical protein COCON_G00180690 [Conger conger]|uniref:Uncharacterized protein n=1 Tax=Conger conger TaxID=82655 RepID=A0A9Q1D6B8_CONCO|nr:hypothetical protein COCON_G00180690 [Conger conger]
MSALALTKCTDDTTNADKTQSKQNHRLASRLLERNDPIYSLCASDLMTASQTVNNNFIKEQKQLIKTLKKLEQQKLLRMRQLNEEKKQFAALMRKKLSQRGAGMQTAFSPSAFIPERADRTFSAPVCHFPAPSHRENSAKNSMISQKSSNITLSKYSPSPQQLLSLDTQKSTGMCVNSTRSLCKCEQYGAEVRFLYTDTGSQSQQSYNC